MRRTLVSSVAFVALLGACNSKQGHTDSSASTPPTVTTAASSSTTTTAETTSTATTTPDLNAARVKLTPVATNLQQPLALAIRKGDDAFYIAQQTGKVVAVVNGGVLPQPVLDISNEITHGNEQGLLGVTFSPDGTRLYIDYTDTAGDTHVQEIPMNGRVADMARRRDVLTVKQPFPNHNGGEVLTGADGMLYIGLGDGGSAGDPNNNGQNLGTLLGKILRINPAKNGGAAYSVPADNPFVRTANARTETWTWGLRNPWRFSFDRLTGDLWIGDVGQNAYEEIDFGPGGGKRVNWGWSAREGFHRFKSDDRTALVDPIFETKHTDGYCAIVGGYVYRGTKIPNLGGAYLFSDNCKGDILALTERNGKLGTERSLGIHADGVSSFGEDATGNLYVLSLAGTVFRVDPA